MDDMSRRHLLRAGSAAAAMGAFGLMAPASARAPWTWAPTGSVAGAGLGVDPRLVWDEEADPVIARLLDSGQVPRVNELLRGWVKNSDPLPAGLPTELRDFIEYARQLPPWVDRAKLDVAARFNAKRGLYLGVLYGFASGMLSTVIPKEALAV
ncbi:MAG: hypothetical protein ACI379_14410 [Nocardioides sp.]|uniref:hypothetical protein n=1 Tax=Nocardioides sp. TaxID=35761 RepID=UPI003F03EC3B